MTCEEACAIAVEDDAADLAGLREHLERCEACALHRRQLGLTIEVLASIPKEEPDARLLEALEREMRRVGRR